MNCKRNIMKERACSWNFIGRRWKWLGSGSLTEMQLVCPIWEDWRIYLTVFLKGELLWGKTVTDIGATVTPESKWEAVMDGSAGNTPKHRTSGIHLTSWCAMWDSFVIFFWREMRSINKQIALFSAHKSGVVGTHLPSAHCRILSGLWADDMLF